MIDNLFTYQNIKRYLFGGKTKQSVSMPSHSRSRYSEVHLSHSDISDNEGHRRSKMSKQTP